MSEIERTDLARERTHAAWLRTSLAFSVSLIAVLHYSLDYGPNDFSLSFILIMGGVGSGFRAMATAPDAMTKALAWSLMCVPYAVLWAF